MIQGRSKLTFPLVAVIVVFGSLLGTVAVQTLIVQNRVQLDQVQAQIAEQEALNQELWLEVVELESPERILEAATSQLGMIRPGERTYLPGVDPDLVVIAQPAPTGDPFGQAPLSDELVSRFSATLTAAGLEVDESLRGTTE